MQTEEERCTEFLAELGLALYRAQALENGLVSLFASSALVREAVPPTQVRELMDTRFKQTLGRLVRDASARLALPDQVVEQLEEALDDRNWLVHHFYWEFAPAAFDPHVGALALTRLREVGHRFEAASEVVAEATRSNFVAAGVSESELEARAEAASRAYVRELLGETEPAA